MTRRHALLLRLSFLAPLLHSKPLWKGGRGEVSCTSKYVMTAVPRQLDPAQPTASVALLNEDPSQLVWMLHRTLRIGPSVRLGLNVAGGQQYTSHTARTAR